MFNPKWSTTFSYSLQIRNCGISHRRWCRQETSEALVGIRDWQAPTCESIPPECHQGTPCRQPSAPLSPHSNVVGSKRHSCGPVITIVASRIWVVGTRSIDPMRSALRNCVRSCLQEKRGPSMSHIYWWATIILSTDATDWCALSGRKRGSRKTKYVLHNSVP